jgi:2-C-methyl-D-erythritol 4-phosphate cytidylyltransferase/2-C-methyl-D-erythritol 2,4-cyclodiphosphate synthase
MTKSWAPGGVSAAAIIVAAGAGTRMGGGVPKQFLRLGGKPLLRWSVDAFLQSERVSQVIIVVPEGAVSETHELLPEDCPVRIVEGSPISRTGSVARGLAALAGDPPALVLIHDAARPGLSAGVIDEVIFALSDADAAAPALPVVDALKRVGQSLETVERASLVHVQTPQAFRWDVISRAYEVDPDAAVDDLALVEASGAKVVLTKGRTELLKITFPEDLALAEKLIVSPAFRIGTGFDVHAFEPGDCVFLCGVAVPHTKRLQGHSDADAPWHALTDAILGALGLGDIGDHFPPSDPQWKGAPSVLFLERAVRLAHDLGYSVVNADITILAERPKIAPHREAMRLATARALQVSPGAVSVKATTTERLGFVGREEGIAAQACVLLSK